MDSQKKTTKTTDLSQTSSKGFCEKHGEYKIETIERFGGGVIKLDNCTKCADDEKKEIEKKQLKNEIHTKIGRSGIEKRYLNSTLGSFKAETDSQKKVKINMEGYVDNYKKIKEHGINIMLSGMPGTGKTHMACGVANALLNKNIQVKYKSMYQIMDDIKDTFRKDSGTSTKEIIDKYSRYSLLIIDEIGVQTGSDYEKTIIFRIINNRYGSVLPTIMITNLDEDGVKKVIGDRVVDRLYENGGGFYSFNWESHRKKRESKNA